MKKLLITYLLLLSIRGFSQDTIITSPYTDSLLMEMANLMQDLYSLQKRMDSICKKTDSIYINLTALDTNLILEGDHENYSELKRQFDIEYSELVHNDNFPNSKPIDISMYRAVGFGFRVHPIYRTSKFHYGIDIPAEKGTIIKATISGKFEISAELARPNGKYVIIEAENGIKTIYSHMDSVYIVRGDFIKKGQIIGTVGNTGRSTQNHLHYEIIIRDVSINPLFAIFSELKESEINLILTKNGMSMD